MIRRKVLSFLLVISMCLAALIPAMATDISGSGVRLIAIPGTSGRTVTARMISIEELPDGIVPLEVNTIEEADALAIAFFTGNDNAQRQSQSDFPQG